MADYNFNKTVFLKSASEISQLPKHNIAEVAFSGASNAGKSSAINAITGIKKLAKTSKTPGRTQLLNFFELNSEILLVDLPGYGYAKVSASIKTHWAKLLDQYFKTRKVLVGLILIMDIRHPFKPGDDLMLDWCGAANLPVHILLTKSDKLSYGASKRVLLSILGQLKLRSYGQLVTAQLFSSPKRVGIEQVQGQIIDWISGDS